MIVLMWWLADLPVAPVQTVTPESVFGWGGFVFGLLACCFLLYDRISGKGRSLATLEGKIDNLCTQLDGMETTQGIMDTHLGSLSSEVRDLVVEWKGVDGEDGWRSILRKHDKHIRALLDRNIRIDAVAEADRQRSGGMQRREMDKALTSEKRRPEDLE